MGINWIRQIGIFPIQIISMQKSNSKRLIKDYVYSDAKLLGSGSTGAVYKGFDINTGNSVAIKVINLASIDNQVSEYLLAMEKTALMSVSSDHVLRGLDVYEDNGKCYFITEFCNGGTLKDLIIREGKLSEERSIELFQGILKGYSDCVRKRILHRDLKPANIMINNSQPKIIDFGYCMIDGFKKPALEYNVGSPSYMAPESHKWNMYNEKTEIWGLGVTYYECVTGRTLDQGRKMSDTFKELLEIGIYYPDHLSQWSKKLISWCLQYDPKRRPTCKQLLREVTKLKKEAVPLKNPQYASKYTSHFARQISQSFLKSTPTTSVDNLPLTQHPYNMVNSGQLTRESSLLEAKKPDILRPRLDSKFMPGSTRENTRPQLSESGMLKTVRNTMGGEGTQRGFHGGHNYKYSLKLEQSNLRDYHKLPQKRDSNPKNPGYGGSYNSNGNKNYLANNNYNNYVTPTNLAHSRQPSMTCR